LGAPLSSALGPLPGRPADLRELVTASHDVTYRASDEKAHTELGDAPRGLEQGLRDLAGSAA
jgi:hypothetical protein